MSSMNERIESGKIKSYDAATATGTVDLGLRKVVKFSFTCFDSGRRTREPRAGEAVQVVFIGDNPAPLAVVTIPAARSG
jgi:hypothetical protein